MSKDIFQKEKSLISSASVLWHLESWQRYLKDRPGTTLTTWGIRLAQFVDLGDSFHKLIQLMPNEHFAEPCWQEDTSLPYILRINLF